MARQPAVQPSADLLDDYQWLVGPEASAVLQTAADWTTPTPAQVAALRKQCSGSRAHLVLELAALRSKARAKFSAAARMYFTAKLLEQASDQFVAAYKAQQLTGEGRRRVFDPSL